MAFLFLLIVLLTSQHLVHCFRYPYTYNNILCYHCPRVSITARFPSVFPGKYIYRVIFPSLKNMGEQILGGGILGRQRLPNMEERVAITSRSLFRVGAVAVDVFVSTH